MKKRMISMVRWYQKHKPRATIGVCRYKPTCSEYMILAIEKYGCIKGGWKGIKRIFRCRPPYGGIDYP